MKNKEYQHQMLISGLQKDVEITISENRDLQRKNKLLQAEIDSQRLEMARFFRKIAKGLEENNRLSDEEIPF